MENKMLGEDVEDYTNALSAKPLNANWFNKSLDKFYKKHKIQKVLDTCDFKKQAEVYIASGHMFNEFGQIGLEIIADICEQIGLLYYLPQRADFNDKMTSDLTITNKMITDGDIKELLSCDYLLAHLTSDMDAGVCGEISRFRTVEELYPNLYKGVIGWADDIRLDTLPNPQQQGVHNQVMYLNQFVIGEVENSLGCHRLLGDVLLKMYEDYTSEKKTKMGDLI